LCDAAVGFVSTEREGGVVRQNSIGLMKARSQFAVEKLKEIHQMKKFVTLLCATALVATVACKGGHEESSTETVTTDTVATDTAVIQTETTATTTVSQETDTSASSSTMGTTDTSATTTDTSATGTSATTTT
jgi:hypothetical protein